MKPWAKNSLNIGALTAGALLASGTAATAGPTMDSSDNLGALTGTQLFAPVQAPINVCGNAVAAGGAAYAACHGGAAAALDPAWSFETYQAQAGPQQATGAGPTLVSTGNTGIGNGTQVYAPIQVPIDVCGNAVAVLGAATGSCPGGATAAQGGGGNPGGEKPGSKYGGGKYGYQHSDSKAEVVAVSSTGPTMTSTGNVGLLNGTQLLLPIQVPINICGNAIGILGIAQAACEGGASATNRL